MKQQSAAGILGALARPIDSDWRHDFGDVRWFHSSSPLVALNPLSFACATRNDDVKPLGLFAAGGEADLQFKPIIVGGIRFRPVERVCAEFPERDQLVKSAKLVFQSSPYRCNRALRVKDLTG